MTTPILIAALLAALYWLRYCRAGPGWMKSAVKTGSVLGLALAAWLAGGPVLLLAALLASALGDFLLSREGEGPFIAGVAAFAAGHVAYVLLFLDHSGGHPGGAPDTLSLPVAYTLASALVLLCGVMGWLLWHRAGALRLPVLLYMPVILAMGLAALTVPLTGALALVLPGRAALRAVRYRPRARTLCSGTGSSDAPPCPICRVADLLGRAAFPDAGLHAALSTCLNARQGAAWPHHSARCVARAVASTSQWRLFLPAKAY